jgi:hydrogenase/urease accessory protein HupE
MKPFLCCLLYVLGVCISLRCDAHEVRPAYLQITEVSPHTYDVLWKQPTLGTVAVRLVPHLSNGWLETDPNATEAAAGFIIKRWRNLQSTGLDGVSVRIEGLERTITDVLVSVTLLTGSNVQTILKPIAPDVVLDFHEHTGLATFSYLQLGIEHILTGIDHLLFVLGLLLLVASRWTLLKTLTAFTLAHSVTLAGTALGWITVQPQLIEALVALSIVFLAVELVYLYRGRPHLTARYPWLIAFAFGLLHGCAFAGALAQVGLPHNAIAAALLLFNLGVEAGQILFVAVVLGALWLLHSVRPSWPVWTRWLAPYAIGSCAMFWLLQRVVIGV